MIPPTILNEHAPEKANRHNKGKLESEKPNIFAINYYKNTVQQRLEDLEERTYEAIDDTPAEQTERIEPFSQFHLQVNDLAKKSMHVSQTQANITPASTFQTMTTNQQPDVANRTCSLQHSEHTANLESTTNLRHAIKKITHLRSYTMATIHRQPL